MAEMLRRKRIPSGTMVDDEGADTGSKAAELEQRYRQLLESIRTTTQSIVHEEERAEEAVADLMHAKMKSAAQADNAHAALMAFKRKVATTAVSGRTGKTLPRAEVEAMLDNEEKKQREVRQEQLKYVWPPDVLMVVLERRVTSCRERLCIGSGERVVPVHCVSGTGTTGPRLCA